MESHFATDICSVVRTYHKHWLPHDSTFGFAWFLKSMLNQKDQNWAMVIVNTDDPPLQQLLEWLLKRPNVVVGPWINVSLPVNYADVHPRVFSSFNLRTIRAGRLIYLDYSISAQAMTNLLQAFLSDKNKPIEFEQRIHWRTYALTDIGATMCPDQSKWIFFTNGDNSYHPDFLGPATISNSSFSSNDLITVRFTGRYSFVNNRRRMNANCFALQHSDGYTMGENYLKLAVSDLGSLLFRTSFWMVRNMSFLSLWWKNSDTTLLDGILADVLSADPSVSVGLADKILLHHSPNPSQCLDHSSMVVFGCGIPLCIPKDSAAAHTVRSSASLRSSEIVLPRPFFPHLAPELCFEPFFFPSNSIRDWFCVRNEHPGSDCTPSKEQSFIPNLQSLASQTRPKPNANDHFNSIRPEFERYRKQMLLDEQIYPEMV